MRRSFDDPSLPVVALLIAAALAWPAIGQFKGRLPLPLPSSDTPDLRVAAIANAIATAEGYFASGDYEGHSLPYRLNNPGALTNPKGAATDLPTWRDTGLIWFPTAEMGWAALRHQVNLMLSGASAIYRPSDTLMRVADKYADGNPDWGVNVAAALRVPPTTTLSDLTLQEGVQPPVCQPSTTKMTEPRAADKPLPPQQ